MKSNLTLILSILLLGSCQPVAKLLYGIKNPAVENKHSIIKKALKYKLDTSNIVTIISTYFIDEVKGKGIPDAAIYDSEGNYIEYRAADTSCNAGLFQFIPDLNLSDEYEQPDRPKLESELLKFRGLKGEDLEPKNKADFYILIYWTVWSGKLNDDHVKIWEDLAKNNKKCKIEVIKVNLDMQEYWEEEERNRIIEAMR